MEYKFNKIEEILGYDKFSFDRILGYMVQLIMAEKWFRIRSSNRNPNCRQISQGYSMTETSTQQHRKLKRPETSKRRLETCYKCNLRGTIRQGEISMVRLEGVQLKAEVIEIVGDVAKIQVFEDTKG